jgi:hypothetical protein
MNENQKVVLGYLKNRFSSSPISGIDTLFVSAPQVIEEAASKLSTKEEYEVLLSIAKWGLGSDEKNR